jgi:mono/diheme cytochrome c family protein
MIRLSVRCFRYVLPACGVGALVLLVIPVRAQDAASLYKAKCAACHGPDGKGDTPVGQKLGIHDFASPDVQKQTDAQLIDIVTNGKNKMPAYKGKLADDQMKGLVAYIRDLAKKK